MRIRATADLNLIFVVLGVGLFAFLVFSLDPVVIGEQLRRAGWAVPPAFLLFVLNLCASTMAWRETIEPGEHGRRIPFVPLLGAFWSGHSIEGVGIATGGEFVKGTLLARRIPAEEAVAALIIYAFLNAVVTVGAAMIGPAIALFAFDLPRDVVVGILLASTLVAGTILAIWRMLQRGPADSIIRIVRRSPFTRNVDFERFERRARLVGRRVHEFRKERPAAFRRTILWCSTAKVLQVIEAWVLIYACLPDRNLEWLLVVALVSRSATLLINWLGAFVPGKIGVAEGGAAALFEVLGIGAGAGLSFSILRRARRVLVILVGLVISTAVAVRDRVQA